MNTPLVTRGDWLVLGASLLLLAWLYATLWSSGGETGGQLHILVDGRELPPISLQQERTLAIDGSIGTSTLRIENGRVRFLSSPCPGQQCVHTGWLSHGGEFAACLPNRIALQIGGDEGRFDTINF